MTPNDLATFTAQVRADEGFRPSLYPDGGFFSIGYGHFLRNAISLAAAEQILEDDIAGTLAELAQRWPFWATLDGVRQRAFADLAFNAGVPGLLTFRKAKAAAELYDWATCADELRDSLWYHQEGDRAIRVCAMVRTGADPAPLTP